MLFLKMIKGEIHLPYNRKSSHINRIMSDEQTKRARELLHEMIRLANCLITESINQTNPVLPPARTVSKQEFVDNYTQCSAELCHILDNLEESENTQSFDQEVEKSRNDLQIKVQTLQEKLDKLNDLRFWVDNMISDDPNK